MEQTKYQKRTISGLEVHSSRNGGIELLLVPGGRFLMGSPPDAGCADERPQHEVEIRPFLLGRYPVTNAEYRRYLEANPDAKEPKYWADRRFNQDRQPVVGVDWEEVRRFCAWAGGRLPTETEWEYACRAGTVTEFHWGDEAEQAGEFAWHWANSGGASHAVGEKRPSPWGFCDLAGNVWEWTEDAWRGSYKGAPADGSAWTQGGDGGRVIRGGSWYSAPGYLRSAYRGWNTPGTRLYILGFRLAKDL